MSPTSVRRLVAALAAAASIVLVVPAAAPAMSAAKAIAHLNAQRAHNGLPASITEGTAMTTGCANHLRYQTLNHTGLTHTEIEGRPGWTREGARLAQGSGGSEVLGFDDAWDDAWENPWAHAPIHLSLMMAPYVETAGYATGASGTCMRMSGGGALSPPPAVYSVPGPGATGVPASWTTNELPYTPSGLLKLKEPTGYDILLWNDLTDVDDVERATLAGPAGSVAVRWVDSRTPVPTVKNGNDVWQGGRWDWGTMLVPVKPLEPGTSYALDVTFTDGTPYHLTFRTAVEPFRVDDLSLGRRLLSLRVNQTVPDAHVTVRRSRGGAALDVVRTLRAGRSVSFRLHGLSTGRYTVRIATQGGRLLAKRTIPVYR